MNTRAIGILLFSFLLASGLSSGAYGWQEFLKSNELYALAQYGSEESHLVKIDPKQGTYTYIGDTGLDNCTALDFTPGGKLKAFCELRGNDALAETKDLELKDGVIAELNPGTGLGEWAAPHGASNFISDITINSDGELFSYENVEPERLLRHLKEDDLFASIVGETGIEAKDHAMAVWRDGVIKLAANTGVPTLYKLDPDTGAAVELGAISYPRPNLSLAAAGSGTAREVAPEDIMLLSMDSVKFGFPGNQGELTTKAGGLLFEESEADFVLLMAKAESFKTEANTRYLDALPPTSVALMDPKTRQVDYVVDIVGDAAIRAIAVRPLEPRPIPTMSEWSLICASGLLLLAAVYFIARRNKAIKSA